MDKIKTIRELDVKNKRVLLRCEFNVPLDEKGNVLDDFRIKATLPTIKYLIDNQAKIILMSHLDDPAGSVVETLRLNKIGHILARHIATAFNNQFVNIIKLDECVGKEIEDLTLKMKPREILLLENLRFHKEEEENNEGFAKELAKLGDLYINDAFGVCHRVHASIVGVPRYLPKAAGLLLEKEIQTLSKMMKNPEKPLVALIGGKKVETKVKLIDKLSAIADIILINDLLQKELREKNIILGYPEKIVASVDSIADNLDIGPETRKLFEEKILQAKSIFWNGPFGKIEEEEFSGGTLGIAKAIIKSRAFSVVGGGETVAFINRHNLTSGFNHISAGGGAMLAFLTGEPLPGIEALKY